MAIFAIKGSHKPDDVQAVFDSLNDGEGRFGWSYISTADLYKLRDRIEKDGEDSLNEAEKDCYHPFLLEFKDGDYVVYINVPQWGHCTLARVTGPYYWRFDSKDFNHRFPVDKDSVRTFQRNDGRVHPKLCARLKLPGKKFKIYAEPEFDELLQSLDDGTKPIERSLETSLRFLSRAIESHLSKISGAIHATFPTFDLEKLLYEAFRNVPGVKRVDRMRGRADQGADLVVEFEAVSGLVQTLVVQVKSYEGQLHERRALEDIEKALDVHNADMGLICSTAVEATKGFRDELDKVRERCKKPIALLIGAELAMFILRHVKLGS